MTGCFLVNTAPDLLVPALTDRIWTIGMTYELRSLGEADRAAVVSIFNYFVERSFAAYPEEPVGGEFFDRILSLSTGYPAVSVVTDAGDVAGFGFLRAFHPAATFRRTAEIAYFLLPEHTGRGIGSRMLSHFMKEARGIGVDNLLASVSSLNEQSLRFHAQAGFERCGTFCAVGRKAGRDFDVVWFQKRI
jgi:phosphinothricin acetyltransferase